MPRVPSLLLLLLPPLQSCRWLRPNVSASDRVRPPAAGPVPAVPAVVSQRVDPGVPPAAPGRGRRRPGRGRPLAALPDIAGLPPVAAELRGRPARSEGRRRTVRWPWSSFAGIPGAAGIAGATGIARLARTRHAGAALPPFRWRGSHPCLRSRPPSLPLRTHQHRGLWRRVESSN